MVRRILGRLGIVWTILLAGNSAAVGQAPSPVDLTALSLEDLMNIEVTLASRKEEKLFEIAAAVFVLTREDIRRSGATSIPQVLRLVPGMQVGQIDASKWAISARGFAARFANKMLVLVDGRHIYSSLFGGVFWEMQDVLLEDIERIEVIRGPGAALWGANSVNGIINIITAPARDTEGKLIQAGFGTEERGFGALRYGDRLGEHAFYRIYAKSSTRGAFVDASGAGTADAWDLQQGGFRADWTPSERDVLSLQGDLFAGDAGQTFRFPTLEAPFVDSFDQDTRLTGGNVLAHWQRDFSPSSDLRLQFFYDRNRRDDGEFEMETDVFDIDLQHRFVPGRWQDIVWGLGYRRYDDETVGSPKVSYEPPARSTDLYSAFIHDEIVLVADHLRLALGSKFEHNSYTGFEYQPSARLLWTPDARQTLWTAISRAVRTPARNDDNVRIAFRTLPALSDALPDSPPLLLLLHGDPSFESEELLSFELGYRLHANRALFFDLAAFYNSYSGLRAARIGNLESNTSEATPYLTIVLTDANLMDGTSHGGELVAEWRFPRDRGRLRAAYSYLKVDLEVGPGVALESPNAENVAPQHQFYLWPSLDLRPDLQLDAVGRYVSRAIARAPSSFPNAADYLPDRNIDAYFELDLRLAWRASRRLEFALVGRNLLAGHHPEFTGFFVDTLPTETQRGIHGTTTWNF